MKTNKKKQQKKRKKRRIEHIIRGVKGRHLLFAKNYEFYLEWFEWECCMNQTQKSESHFISNENLIQLQSIAFISNWQNKSKKTHTHKINEMKCFRFWNFLHWAISHALIEIIGSTNESMIQNCMNLYI